MDELKFYTHDMKTWPIISIIDYKNEFEKEVQTLKFENSLSFLRNTNIFLFL